MPTISSGGQFGGSPYSNPRMSLYGANPSLGGPPGWINPNTPAANYQQQFAPDQTMWVGDTPGHQGQSYSYNPMTGEAGWVNSTEGLILGSGNSVPGTGGSTNGAVSFIDPETGMQTLNLDFLMRKVSQLADQYGAGNSANMAYNPYELTDFEGGDIVPPEAYAGGDWDIPKNVVNVHDVIESYRPQMEREIAAGAARAGNRLGQSGMAMSTPYATALGETEQAGRDRMNQRAMEFQYDAGKFDAGNQMTGLLAKNQEAFNSWLQSGNWDMAAQGGNIDNAMKQWMMENQYGFADNQAKNQFDFTQNQQQDNFMNQLLSSILGGL